MIYYETICYHLDGEFGLHNFVQLTHLHLINHMLDHVLIQLNLLLHVGLQHDELFFQQVDKRINRHDVVELLLIVVEEALLCITHQLLLLVSLVLLDAIHTEV